METAALMNEYEEGTAVYGETIFSDMTRKYAASSKKVKFKHILKTRFV